MRVCAIDPGLRTGLAWGLLPFTGPDLLPQIGTTAGIRQIEARTELEICHRVRKAIKALEPDVLVIEDYIIRLPVRSTDRELLAPVRVHFGLELMFKGRIPIVSQMPSEMSVVTDARLKAWGLWRPGVKWKDARAAQKHLIVYARKHAAKTNKR